MKGENIKKDWLNEAVFLLSRPWILGLALAFVLIPTTKMSSALESGAEFLKIDTDAKAVSMGSAYTAMARGVDAVQYNPAGLAGVDQPELGFSHTTWLLGSNHDFIGVAVPVGGKSTADGRQVAVGLGFTRLSNGSMEGRATDRGRTGGFEAYDQSIALGAAKNFGPYALGGSVKYIQSTIAGARASAFAVDIGAGRHLSGLPVYVALAVQNLGTPMRYMNQSDPLPLSASAGLLVTAVPGVDLSLDFKRYIHEGQTNYNFGMNYNILPGFALRTGYLMNSDRAGAGLSAVNIGAGVNIRGTQLDYAVSPYGDLGNTQKITLKKKF